MKHFILFFVLITFYNVNAQNEVFFFKDSLNQHSFKTIEKVTDFKLVKDLVLDKYSDASFWFKIPKAATNKSYFFKINSISPKNPKAYQNSKEVKAMPNSRYLSYEFTRENDVYIKMNSFLVSYFPVELKEESSALFDENLQFLINGFYYGFSFLVILYSLFHFYFFRDYTFLYYALFMISVVISYLILDGILKFLGISKVVINIVTSLNYILAAYSLAKFVNSFLILENVYPNVKKYAYSIGAVIVFTAFIFMYTNNQHVFMLLNALVFLLFIIYWFSIVLLYNRDDFTKILVFAFALSLFSGVDTFVLRNYGITFFDNYIVLKVGGVLQIIGLWFALVLREKTLRKKNSFMKTEIIKYLKQLESKKSKGIKDFYNDNLIKLSIREREIFDLIVKGKSNKEIASQVNISVNTVKFHVKNIYDKLNIKSRKEALNISKAQLISN